ncbi:MAG: UDP-N-acetylglucosamine 2-epimerase, partial [bacterium]
LIITDSGGIQEEAPAYKTPVIVVRNKTERPEGLKDKFIILAGTNKKQIINKTLKYLNHKQTLLKLNIPNPYGDGKASERILNIITQNHYSPFLNTPNVQIY